MKTWSGSLHGAGRNEREARERNLWFLVRQAAPRLPALRRWWSEKPSCRPPPFFLPAPAAADLSLSVPLLVRTKQRLHHTRCSAPHSGRLDRLLHLDGASGRVGVLYWPRFLSCGEPNLNNDPIVDYHSNVYSSSHGPLPLQPLTRGIQIKVSNKPW